MSDSKQTSNIEHRTSNIECGEEGEAAVWFVLKESQARKLVAAAENGRAHQVVEILKLQPWWPEICAGVRRLRHLKPLGYIELSKRPNELAASCFLTSDLIQ